MNKPLIQACIFLLTTLVATHAWAQSGSAPVPWGKLSPNEKKVLAPLKKSWNQLPAARQHRMKKGADRWAGMSAEDRLKTKKRLKRWKKLDPDKKKRIRDSFEEFKKLSSKKRKELQQQWQESTKDPKEKQPSDRPNPKPRRPKRPPTDLIPLPDPPKAQPPRPRPPKPRLPLDHDLNPPSITHSPSDHSKP